MTPAAREADEINAIAESPRMALDSLIRSNHDRDRYRQRSGASRHSNRQSAKTDMRQAVSNHGIPLEHQAYAKQCGAQRNKDSHDDGTQHKRIGKQVAQQIKHDRHLR